MFRPVILFHSYCVDRGECDSVWPQMAFDVDKKKTWWMLVFMWLNLSNTWSSVFLLILCAYHLWTDLSALVVGH